MRTDKKQYVVIEKSDVSRVGTFAKLLGAKGLWQESPKTRAVYESLPFDKLGREITEAELLALPERVEVRR